MSEVLIPPWTLPQAESSTLIDDSTSIFRPAYAPGVAQRVSYVEPRLQVKQSFKSLRSNERAAMLAALANAKGKFATVRAAVGYAIRGSFPTTELISNNTFANGSTGWTPTGATVAVADRSLRLTANSRASDIPQVRPTIAAAVQYAPYVSQALFGNRNRGGLSIGTYIDGSIGGAFGDYSADFQGLDPYDFTALTTAITGQIAYIYDSSGNVALPGDWMDLPFASVTRCAKVDNSPNAQIFGEALDNAAWTKTRLTVTANAVAGPNGVVSGDALVEDTSNNTHFLNTAAITKSAAAEDWCACGFFKANTRSQVLIEAGSLGANYAEVIVNLTDGSIALAPTLVGTATNARAYVVNCQNGWFYVALVVNIPASVTTTNNALFGIAVGGAISYLGNGSSIYAWRCAYAKSTQPFNPNNSSVTLPVGVPTTGNTMRLMGLPVSTAGLLLAGDTFVVGGELKMCTAQVDSDAAGKGSVQFSPALCRSPAHDDPIIIGGQFGKFILAENPSWSNDYGVYADVDITLEAINE